MVEALLNDSNCPKRVLLAENCVFVKEVARNIASDAATAIWREIRMLRKIICLFATHIPGMTLAQVAQSWLDDKRLSMKVTSFSMYRSRVCKHILPELGMYRMSQINKSTVKQFTVKLIKTKNDGGFGLSHKTAEDILIVLKSILRYGKCPCCKDLGEVRIYRERNEPVILTNAEQTKLSQYLYGVTGVLQACILLCILTGLRIGDAYVKHKLKNIC